MNVAYEPWEPQQPQQTEDLGEAYDPQCARRLVKIWIDARLHNEEDVVHGDRGDEVHHEPWAQIFDLDLLRVQNDLRVVLLHNSCAEVQHQVHEEEGVGNHVEDDPRRRVLVLEEGDAHGNDDEISHHQEQHGEIPVKPGGELQREVSMFTNVTMKNCTI